MLTQIENFSIELVHHFCSKRGHVSLGVGKKFLWWDKWRLTQEEFDAFLDLTWETPYRFELDSKVYWLFEEKLYKDSNDLEVDEVKAVLIARQRVQDARIARAKTIAASPETPHVRSRATIPDDMKLLVWQRDGGCCTRCGSTTEIQYDHVIPVSLGGATTPENLQILCGPCNRAKGNSLV